jgi:AmmeMemoRadiSam system protein B
LDFAGFDAREHALLVKERSRLGLVFDPGRPPRQLLAAAVRHAQVRQPGNAAVFGLRTISTSAFAVSMAPRAERGGNQRPAAVAGKFYPADAAELSQVVNKLLAGERTSERWPAAMVPHAGLRFSGRVAAAVLRRIELPRTIIVLGPKHTPDGADWAVAPHETWLFPGGALPSDLVLARQLCEAIPGLEMDAAAHKREHAIEVELPLLARLAPQARVVGIVVGQADLDSCREFARGLAAVLAQRQDRPLLLISSDMNHFACDEENRRLDTLALDALEQRDPALLYSTVMENGISMCGLRPAVIVMETLRLLGGLTKVERVAYTTSAEATGDSSRVVGYAGVLIE